ncbi:MAG: (2Fe-2S) ferredoxin domain-containing protein [Acholeplasmataceae bacterium]
MDYQKLVDIKKTTKEKMRQGIRIQVGMGTCGIAAGAREVLEFFEDEILRRNLKNVHIHEVGCMGECAFEPLVEIIESDGNSIIYCRVTVDRAQEIVDNHLVNGIKLEKYSLYRLKK